MDARNLIIVVGTLSLAMGCASLKRETCCGPPTPGIVTTGGQYAAARSLVIPPEGLTLGQVVEQTLRPGVDAVTTVPVTSQVAAGPTTAPPTKKSQTLRWATNLQQVSFTPPQLASLVTQDVIKNASINQPTAVVVNSLMIQTWVKQNQSVVQHSTGDAQVNAIADAAKDLEAIIAFGMITDDNSKSTDVIHNAGVLVNWLLKSESIVPTDIDGQIEKQLEDGSLVKDQAGAIDTSRARSLFEQLRRQTQPATTIVRQSQLQPSIRDSLVVVLTHTNKHSIIMPLWMTRNYSAADIWLVSGDHVQVIPFQTTNVTAPASGGNVAVTGITKSEGIEQFTAATTAGSMAVALTDNRADIMILRRINAAGALDEFLLPLDREDFYGADQPVQSFLDGSQIGGGDQVHFDRLDLTPLIRTSRQQLIAASANAANPANLATPCKRHWMDLHARKVKVANHIDQSLGAAPSTLTKNANDMVRTFNSNVPAALQ